MEAILDILNQKLLVSSHGYRADEFLALVRLAEEFGFRIQTLQHGVEAYKIASELKKSGVAAVVWSDWGAFKMEAYDAIPENAAILHNTGACVIIHSDDENQIQRLNQEAAKAQADGRRMGFNISDAEVIKWLTYNPAKALGISDKTGSLKAGKMADVVLWNGNPLSVYARPDKVWIDGALMFDSSNPKIRPVSDFELGQPGEGDVK